MFQVSKIDSKSVEEFVSRFFLFKLAVINLHRKKSQFRKTPRLILL